MFPSITDFVMISPEAKAEEPWGGGNYKVLFRQLTGTKSPFTYPFLLPPSFLRTFSSAALTARDSEI